ncbi:response regulator [Paenibacillus methanolicus]|uniref:Two-component system response regulator YesN n=1 Tax=Paenibacillus methanolicus TaxID=582686 RepID=A0A5S5CGQ3_9BACL|nr:response regulator [Paenibacillus methanolicus]TYP78956.1 two-component system response regulator YesN [Paenibacillus methanolicus]
MYRLLIVDDEPVIVNGLVHLFEEHAELALDVRKAYSSKEAVILAQRMKFDILISDIRMPHKNGLQLVEEIRYYWPLCRVIFLTGYSEFDYVHEALRKNADNYILKTEGIEPIFEAVAQAVRKLDEEDRRRAREEIANLHFRIAEPVLKRELIGSVLSGGQLGMMLRDRRYGEIGFAVEAERPFVLLFGVFRHIAGAKTAAPLSSEETRAAMHRALDYYLPLSFAREGMMLEDDAQVWLLQPDEALRGRLEQADRAENGEPSGIFAYLKGIAEFVQNDCERHHGATVSFGLLDSVNARVQVEGKPFQILLNRLRAHAAAGRPTIIVGGGTSASGDADQDGACEDNPQDMHSLIVQRVHAYIREHLNGDTSLTAIADHVHLNPSYLSRYYKQTTGCNLLDHIQSKKVEEASRLLTLTSLKMQEIALRTGFDSPSYFTTFFKRKTGISPQEYRNLKGVNKVKER